MYETKDIPKLRERIRERIIRSLDLYDYLVVMSTIRSLENLYYTKGVRGERDG